MQAMGHARLIYDASVKFAPMIGTKSWWLGRTTQSHPFMIGDHPIGLQNSMFKMMYPNSPRGSLGLMSPGVEVYLPITPTLILIMVDNALTDNLVNAAQSTTRQEAPEVHDLRAAIKKGQPIEMSAANVENLNSLQIAAAETFVFASTGDFALAKLMVAENPEINGPRFVIG